MRELPTAPGDRILVIDDNPSIHEDFRKILGATPQTDADLSAMEAALFSPGEGGQAVTDQPTYRVDTALRGQDGVAMAEQAVKAGDPYVLAFVDMRMPNGWDGLETIEHLWRVDANIQTVICTAYSDHSWSEMRSRLGASDRLLVLKKPFDNIEILQVAAAMTAKYALAESNRAYMQGLGKAVQARTAELRKANEQLEEEVNQRRAAEQQLQYDATHDALTGLSNRATLVEGIDRAIKRRQREPGYDFAVLFIDLDDFKVVNDSLGHDAGDVLLKEIARRFGQEVREVDTIGRVVDAQSYRLGGDEFVVLLDGIHSPEDALRVCERLQEAMKQPVEIDGHAITPKMSIGVATSRPDYVGAADVLRDADTALYHAKGQGKNDVAVFDQQMHTAIRERLVLETELRDAITNAALQVHYQPIVSLTTGRVHGFEALVRWQHPKQGWIAPAQFLPAAELCGLAPALDMLVLEKACADLVDWRQANADLPDLWLSVNLSARQLYVSRLADDVAGMIERFGLPHQSIRLELTETSVMEHKEAALVTLSKLRQRQILLSMDDFGTGYSSLSNLQELPISIVKIDRGFVQRMSLEGRPYSATVQAIVELAHNHELQVVAEGIETTDQLFQLQSLDCDFGQGFLFARPMPADQVVQRYITGNRIFQLDQKSLASQQA